MTVSIKGQGELDSSGPADDPEFLAAVEEYMTLLESGQRPDRREFSRRHPAFAADLEKCLAGLEAVHGASANKRSKSDAVDPHVGKALGDFQIVREVGRGGMGVVYEATQLSLGRKVALKVLPFAATFDAKHLARFRNEAQAAAQLHHSNIVPVFAVGCERGVHFYAMQLIEGQSLALTLEQMRHEQGLKATPFSYADQDATTKPDPPASPFSVKPLPPESSPTTSSLPRANTVVGAGTLSTQHSTSRSAYFRSVVRLFVQAAEGLDHAHQVGIVHRDVKPANLLVDARGNLWITDFGLAQFRSESHLTRTGDLVGTLRYMSPEQAGGRRAILDHRSDVYSLGATLYEMVTLQPIFAGGDSIEILRHIERDDPVPPREVDKAIPVELETIILKAVSKSPTDRYATAQDMAADLQRFLDDKPILARRPSLVDRVRKWGRRHPAVLASAVGCLVFALIGMGISNRLISEEQDKTRKALEGERRRGDEAERRFAQAQKAVDLLFKVAEEELADKPQNLAARKKVLQTALVFYQDLIDQRSDSPQSQAEIAKAQNKVREILADLTTLEGSHRLDLLAESSVLDDLKLDADGRARAREFAQAWADQRFAFFREVRGVPFDQRQPQFVALIRTHEDALAGLLTPEQAIRLQQIAIQTKGIFAFEDADVAAKLQLTAAQKTKIREIHAEAFDRMFDRGPIGAGGPDRMFDKRDKNPFDRPKPGGEWGKGPPEGKGPAEAKGPPPEGRNPFEIMGDVFRSREHAAHRAGVERVLGILTPEQRTQWTAMAGPAFTGNIRISPFFISYPKESPQRFPRN